MHIHTIEEDYEYRMKNLIDEFVEQYELKNLHGEMLENEIWENYAKEFGRAVLEDMVDFAGEDLFE